MRNLLITSTLDVEYTAKFQSFHADTRLRISLMFLRRDKKSTIPIKHYLLEKFKKLLGSLHCS